MTEFKTVEEYIEHLKGLTTVGVLEHEDIHFAFVREKGWNIENLKAFLDATRIDDQEAKKLKQEEEGKERVKQAKESAAKIVEGLKEEVDPKKIKEGLESIGKLPSLLSSVDLKPCTWQDYMNDINRYDPTQDFCPEVFTVRDKNEAKKFVFKLPFPPQTLSVIGARTKRGKTIMLINLALDAIENGRKCMFISLEMTSRQLLNRLVLLRTYSQAVKDSNDTRLKNLKELESPSVRLWKFLKNKTEENTNAYNAAQDDTINLMFKEASDFIQDKMNSREFELIEALTAEQDQIIHRISEAKKGTLALIDYIQRIPEEEGYDYDGGYMRITKINKELINATFKSEAITICAAQFNRTGGTDSGGADDFDDTSFKESGSIEQDAHNAIGIGFEGNKKDRFYEILKARDSGGTGRQFSLEFNGAYSYMGNEGDRNRKGKDEPKESKKTGSENEEKTAKKRSSKMREELGF
jgi:KaiC/GvpD/RAD55 family RecA-like ATPase